MSTSDNYNEKLQKRYNEPGQVNSIDALYRHFNKEIPRSYISRWMKKNPYQQISKPAFKSKDVNPFNVTDPSYAQIDLIYTKGLYPDDYEGNMFKYLMVCVVLLTRKVFLYPLTDKTLAESKKAVLNFKKDYPPLKVIQSDNGTEFKYEKSWLKEHGLKSVKSSAYNPTSQAYVERMNSVVKNSLYKFHQKTGKDVLTKEVLEQTADSINDQPNRNTGVIPNNATTKENLEKLIKANQDKLEKASKSERDNVLDVGTKVRVSLTKTNLTTKERNKFKTQKNWIPKFTTELFIIHKVNIHKEGFKAPTYELKAAKEGDEKILKGKRFLRRDLQPVDKDTDKNFKPVVDLIKRDTESRPRGRPRLVEEKVKARKAWGVLWMSAKNFTNRTGKFDVGKKERQEELVKAHPKIKKLFDAFIQAYTNDPPLTTLQKKNFEKLKRVIAEPIEKRRKLAVKPQDDTPVANLTVDPIWP